MTASSERSTRTVLLVEDDPPTRGFVRELLDDAGFVIVDALDGEEALRIAREVSPGAVLLDLMLPKKSGWAVLDELKADRRTRHIPVIVVTGFGDPAVDGALREKARIIVKPFDVAELLSQLEQAFAESRTA